MKLSLICITFFKRFSCIACITMLFLWSASAYAATIKIGAINPLSGRFAKQGVETHQGIEVAVAEANAAGGIGDRLLQLVSRDDQSQPDVAISRAEELCAWEKVVALTGGYVDSLVGPISEVAKKHKIPYVASASLQKELVQRENDYFFRVSKLKGFVEPLCDVISEQFHPKRLAIIHAATPGSTELAQDLERCLGLQHIAISLKEKFRPGTPDFTPLISKIKQMNIDVVISGGFTPDHILFVHQLKENNASLNAFIGPFGIAYDSFIKEMGNDAEYLYSTSAWAPEFTLPGSESLSMTFIQKFQSMFNRRPNTTNMHGYTSAKAIIAAMQNVLSAGKMLTGPNIRQALVDLDITLPMEHLVFDQRGDPRHYRHVVVQIQKGRLEVVYPQSRSTSPAVYPMPTWEQRK